MEKTKDDVVLLPVTYTRNSTEISSGGYSWEEIHILLGTSREVIKPNTFPLIKEIIASRKKYSQNNSKQYTNIGELVFFHKKYLKENLEAMIPFLKNFTSPKEFLYIGQNTQIQETVVFDTSLGPIIIEDNVIIEPFTFMKGPMRIKEGTTIRAHSVIEGSVIGKKCKIGGEISGSIIEDYSNKGHHGFLGDSYIGSWVNIGAGTSTSNLKNTYGTITIQGINTGEQFLGSVIADHVKIAINSSLYTGKIIGVAAQLYGTITCDVPSFTNYLLTKEKMIVCPVSVVEKAWTSMKRRRGLEITEEEKKMLLSVYNRTRNERDEKHVLDMPLSF